MIRVPDSDKDLKINMSVDTSGLTSHLHMLATRMGEIDNKIGSHLISRGPGPSGYDSWLAALREEKNRLAAEYDKVREQAANPPLFLHVTNPGPDSSNPWASLVNKDPVTYTHTIVPGQDENGNPAWTQPSFWTEGEDKQPLWSDLGAADPIGDMRKAAAMYGLTPPEKAAVDRSKYSGKCALCGAIYLAHRIMNEECPNANPTLCPFCHKHEVVQVELAGTDLTTHECRGCGATEDEINHWER